MYLSLVLQLSSQRSAAQDIALSEEYSRSPGGAKLIRGHGCTSWPCSTVDRYRCGAGRPDWFSKENGVFDFLLHNDVLYMRYTASPMLLGRIISMVIPMVELCTGRWPKNVPVLVRYCECRDNQALM